MSELVQRFIDRFHDTDYYTNLVNAWQSARRAQARQVDEWTILTLFLELGEVVVRELATLAFSLSVSGAGLESDFRGFRTSGERTFGTEVEILRLLKDRHPVRQLMGARPTPQDALRPLGQLVGHMGQLIHPQHDAAWFNDAIRNTSPNDDHTTWRQAVDHLCAIRNIQFHATARLDKDRKRLEFIAHKLRDPVCTRLVANEVSNWVSWISQQAVGVLEKFDIVSCPENDDRDMSTIGRAKPPPIAQYYVDRESAQPERHRRVECLQDIDDALREARGSRDSDILRAAGHGRLLAVIGPEFGYPCTVEDPVTATVIDRAYAAVGDPDHATLAPFLSRIVTSRLRLERTVDLRDSEGPTRSTPCSELVGALGLLAARAADAIGTALRGGRQPVAPDEPLELDEGSSQELHRRLHQVRDELLTRRDLAGPANKDLGAKSMAEHLEKLASLISRPGNHDPREPEHASPGIVRLRMTLSQAAWLSDLVWHALRWDAPFYPDSRALGIQLALSDAQGQKRMEIPVGAPAGAGPALYVEDNKCRSYLRDWFGRVDARIRDATPKNPTPRATRSHHQLLAEVMGLCLQRRFASSAPPERALHAIFIIDASLDQRMRVALERAGVDSAVVFPVSVGRRDAWRLRRFPGSKDPSVPTWETFYEDSHRSIAEHDVPRVVLVKPLGAPAEDKGPQSGESDAIEHRLLLDDVTVLSDLLRSADSLPPGLRSEIHGNSANERTAQDGRDPRGVGRWDIYFLGYPLDEVGGKTRIIADLRPIPDTGDKLPFVPVFHSQVVPDGLTRQYLERAGFECRDESLSAEMQDLDDRLKYIAPTGE